MSAAAPSVLIVDDDVVFRRVLARELAATGFQVAVRASGTEMEPALLTRDYDVVLLDLRMPGMDGLAALARVKDLRPLTEVVILTGHGSVESAVQALKLGAHDFLTKPCDLDHLEATIWRAAQLRAIRSENEALRQTMTRHAPVGDLIGHSPAMTTVRALVEKVAPTNSTVLIRGETGVGKEVVAKAIHHLSPRCNRPFVVLDCGATEESIALSELFGHEQGAFTGAKARHHGLFELADSGTILIDEIGDTPPSLQLRLLRVLETGALRRLGGEQPLRVDVRILAATHRDLESLVHQGKFREDLYFRLNVFAIDVPPLRRRAQDIPEFIQHFLTRLCPSRLSTIDPRAAAALTAYSWPGNVRELRNVLERALILSGGLSICADHLPGNLSTNNSPVGPRGEEAPLPLQEVEWRYLESLLTRYDGHRGRVAAALGISERTLYRKLRRHP